MTTIFHQASPDAQLAARSAIEVASRIMCPELRLLLLALAAWAFAGAVRAFVRAGRAVVDLVFSAWGRGGGA